MDNYFLSVITEEIFFIIVKCVCMIAQKYNLTWMLRKCQWSLEKVNYVNVDVFKKVIILY